MFLLIQEKSDVEAKLTEKDEALKGLQVILMKMTGEKDELAGENRTLKEQMELYKVCFSGTCINGLSSKKKINVFKHWRNALKRLNEMFTF